MTERRKLFGKTASEATKDKPVAREAGRVAGSALIGTAAGLGVKGLAENGNMILDRVAYKAVKDKNGKVKELVSRKHGLKIAKKLKPAADKVVEISKTKGGKVALIGVPTAVVGGVVYKSSKKKDKKK